MTLQFKATLETLYRLYHRPEYRLLDPVEVVWRYANPDDQAIAGLWAALFAWGRRQTAIQKTQQLLALMGPSPADALRENRPLFVVLRHRTWNPETIVALWQALQVIYQRYGGLQAFFRTYHDRLWEGVAAFQQVLIREAPILRRHLGDLKRGSASKRLWLWLRWMVRCDTIDPGPWAAYFSPQALYIPLDTHVLRWTRTLGLIAYQTPSWQAAQALTAIFRETAPEDPLRYDFAIVTAGALGHLYKVTCPS